MIEIDVPNWKEFLESLELEKGRVIDLRADRHTGMDGYLFRGQSDSRWHLRTTLERHRERRFGLDEYHRLISTLKPQVESFTGQRWELSSRQKFQEELRKDRPADIMLGQVSAYEFMTHLRHVGFPSPLLDWTQSPYLAAFFAYRDCPPDAEKVAIFVYLSSVRGERCGTVGEPEIGVWGPNVTTHSRHFLQQSTYTICTTKEQQQGWIYIDHAFVFADPTRRPHSALTYESEDVLWKFTLPASERKMVLRHLQEYNVTAHSLFGSEESLLETIATRTFLLDN